MYTSTYTRINTSSEGSVGGPLIQINKRALWYIGNNTYHLARKGVPFGQRIVEFILDTRDIFPELEHLFCRRKRVRTDDPNR